MSLVNKVTINKNRNRQEEWELNRSLTVLTEVKFSQIYFRNVFSNNDTLMLITGNVHLHLPLLGKLLHSIVKSDYRKLFHVLAVIVSVIQQ